MANIVNGSVGDISAPKNNVSKNVKLLLNAAGHNLTAPYIKTPIKNADMVVPMIANVRMAPRLRKKYFYGRIF